MKKNKLHANFNTKTITNLAMLFAMTIVLVVLENSIPAVPFFPPGVKLGLSNIVIMFCIFYIGKKEALLLLFLKILFVFITRGVVAFFMSFCGGILSFIVMILLISLKKMKLSYIIISVFAAVAHNIGQLAAASILLDTMTFYYAPILILSGIFMGIVTGIILKVLIPALSHVTINRM